MSENGPSPHRAWGALYTDGVDTSFRGGRFQMNPAPSNLRCGCCHRHVSKLEPFGGPGEPPAGGYTGALLIRRYRPPYPFVSDQEKNDYRERYGQDALNSYESILDALQPSWECRDCIGLPSDTSWGDMALAGKPIFPWADVEECRNIRQGIQRQNEESRKAVLEGRMVIISFREEARMKREGILDEFEQRLRRENRRLGISVDASDS